MSLRRYRLFTTVVEVGSITRAAGVLHIAQPALSQQIRTLEQELGVKLFERSATGVRLTPQGELAYERARQIIRAEALLRQDLSEQSALPAGQVAIGIPSSTAVPLATPLVRLARERYPSIRLRVITGISGNLERALVDGRLDMTILFRPQRPDIMVEAVYLETLFLMVPPGLTVDDPFPLSRIPSLPMILPSPTYGVRSLIDAAFETAEVRPNVIAEIDGSIPTTNELVIRGLGSSLMPWSTMAADVQAGRLQAVPTDPPVVRPVSLARMPAVPLSRAGQAVWALTLDAMRDPVNDRSLARGLKHLDVDGLPVDGRPAAD